MKVKFFKTPSDYRKWLEKNHAKAEELWVGYYKRDSGKPSITWPESVDEALCFGWIDGIRKSLDDISYTIRFTPRRPRSNWSIVNIRRAQELIKTGQMQPAGLKAFQNRKEERSGVYSYEQKDRALDERYMRQLQANEKAWNFFQAQAPWYQRTASRWIVSAKKEETRQKRLDQLIADSEQGRSISPLMRTRNPTPIQDSGGQGGTQKAQQPRKKHK